MPFLNPAGVAGLEIDEGEARAVELRGDRRAPVVAAWGRTEIPEGAVLEGTVVRPEAVAEALEKLWSTSGINARDVALGVANQGVVIRFATMPKVPENRLPKLIRYQAQDYLPFPLNEVVLDYAVVGERSGENGPLLDILMVAARRDMLNGFLDVLAAAGLRARIIDASPLALARIRRDEDNEGGAIARVDIGNGLSYIVLTVKGTPRFARLMPVSLRDAARVCGCSPADIVPKVEEKMPTGDGDRHSNPLRAWCESLAGEIRSSIGYYVAQPGALNIERVLLSGRGARLVGLPGRLEESLGLSVDILRPLEGMAVQNGTGGPDITYEAPDFAVCLGLALRGLAG
ncbi:MAG: type IV pilus assembly protein PilM [Bacillota bacterium]|nr:type IV pilus assembly protein PilM [Bacillota bacterium]